VPWIPNGEVVDARSHVVLVRRREGGSFSSFPPQTGGIGRWHLSAWSLSSHLEGSLLVRRGDAGEPGVVGLGFGTPSHVHPRVVEDS